MDQSDINYVEFAAALDETREVLRAVVAGLVQDGFTDTQAHEIAAAAIARACRGQQ